MFGLVTSMVFVDVIKLMTGQLRPNFLEVCKINSTLCVVNGNVGGDELCTNKDVIALRHARLLLLKSLHLNALSASVFQNLY